MPPRPSPGPGRHRSLARVLVPSSLLLDLWHAAVAAAQPAACLARYWPDRPTGRLAIIACGKAAPGMAEAAVRHFGVAASGLLIHPDTGADPPALPGFRNFPATHPVPASGSVVAARAALRLAASLAADDLLLVLLSGGGSALMCLPTGGLRLDGKQALTRRLLESGAAIGEINCVRKHLSAIKGGRLARASLAPVVTLAISDVAGDDPASIASGPTVPDPTTLADARAVLERYRIRVPAAAVQALLDPGCETPKSARPRDRFEIVASGMTALRAAANRMRGQAVKPIVLGDALQGSAKDLGEVHARRAREVADTGGSACLLSGGETTVALGPGVGRGGPNTEYALALALALEGRPGIWALAADTDGIDGTGGHSGALVDPGTLARGRAAGLNPGEFLERHDSAAFFEQAGGLLGGGPTGTNVNDFRAILVNPGVAG